VRRRKANPLVDPARGPSKLSSNLPNGDESMTKIIRTTLILAVAATLAACASQAPGIDLNAPQPKRVDAKTSLESSEKY
jgi:hypothetical protein